MSAATHTAADQHADTILAELNRGYHKSGHHPRCATGADEGCDCYARTRQPARAALAALRARAAAADTLADALREIVGLRLDTTPGVSIESAVGKARIRMRHIATDALAVYDAAAAAPGDGE